MSNSITSTYHPRPHMIPFHARSNRFSIMVQHRRAGKTVACINDIIDKAIQCPFPLPRYAYIAPLYKQAKDVAWTYLKSYASPLITKVMESELAVTLSNGALIRLYGADNPDALRGVYFDGVILDEYGNMSPRLFGEVIAPTLADRKGWVVFIGTPNGPNHFYDLWNDAVSDHRWYTQMLRASESGIIDEEELILLSNLPGSDEDTFAQEFECDFNAAVRGAYYGKLINKLGSTITDHIEYDPLRPTHLAFDIGYSDDTSIWFFQTDGKTIHIVDFFTVSGYSADDILSALRGSTLPDNSTFPAYAYGTFWLPHDAKNKSFQTGKSVRELFLAQKAQVRMVPELSVQDGIQAARITLPTCVFNVGTDSTQPTPSQTRVRQGLNALKVYQREWDDKKRIFKQTPLHDWSSNPADAFRYLSLAINSNSLKHLNHRLDNPKTNSTPTPNVINLNNLFAERERNQILDSQGKRI